MILSHNCLFQFFLNFCSVSVFYSIIFVDLFVRSKLCNISIGYFNEIRIRSVLSICYCLELLRSASLFLFFRNEGFNSYSFLCSAIIFFSFLLNLVRCYVMMSAFHDIDSGREVSIVHY